MPLIIPDWRYRHGDVDDFPIFAAAARLEMFDLLATMDSGEYVDLLIFSINR